MTAKSSQTQAENQDRPTDPITKREDVQKSNDKHIDFDFPGYPHLSSKEIGGISQASIAGHEQLGKKNSIGEKHPGGRKQDQLNHNGSGGAFEQTESGSDEDHISNAADDIDTDRKY